MSKFWEKFLYGPFDWDDDGDYDFEDSNRTRIYREKLNEREEKIQSHYREEQEREFEYEEFKDDTEDEEIDDFDDDTEDEENDYCDDMEDEEDDDFDDDTEDADEFFDDEVTDCCKEANKQVAYDGDKLLKYYDYEWNFFYALYDNFKEIRQDYDREQGLSLEDFLSSVASYDIDKAFFYWKWVMETFTPAIINKGYNGRKGDVYKEPASRILSCFYNEEKVHVQKKLIEVLKDDYYFNYIFRDMDWDKHNYYAIANTLKMAYLNDDFELTVKCYNAYKKYQSDKYSNCDIVEIWDSFLSIKEQLKLDILRLITEELRKVKECGSALLQKFTKLESTVTKDKDNLLRYYDYEWNFFYALYDNFEEIRQNYDREQGVDLKEFLLEVASYDIDKAIFYWKWVMKTFTKEIIQLGYEDEDDIFVSREPASHILEVLLYQEEFKPKLIEVLKEDYYFNYIFKDMGWEKHDTGAIEGLLKMAYEYAGDEFTIKCYTAYKQYQVDNYSNVDIVNIWKDFINLKKLSKDILIFIKGELSALKCCGEGVLRQVEDLLKKLGHGNERKLEIEKKALLLLKNFDEGKEFDESYKQENRFFSFYFLSTNKTYDTASNLILSKYSEVEDYNQDYKVGQISSKNIEDILMITVTTGAFDYYVAKKYYDSKNQNYQKENSLDVNDEICEYVCKYSYFGQAVELIHQAIKYDMFYNMDSQNVVSKVSNIRRDIEKKLRDNAKTIFNDACSSGKVKIPWIEERKLYSCVCLKYADAVYKFKSSWSENYYFDIYIPELNTVIEYKESLPKKASNYGIIKHEITMQKFSIKELLCKQHGIKFIAWNDDLEITEENVMKLLKEKS